MRDSLINAKHLFLLVFTLVALFFLDCKSSERAKGAEIVLDATVGAGVKVHARICPSIANNLTFPEDSLNLRKTGICMSGGGSRAMVCAIGQLQALRKIGVLDSVGYLSCVSGGSWASVPFTYYNAGAKNDDQLLGTIKSPSQLTLSGMDSFTPGFLGAAASCPLLNTMLGNLLSTPTDDLWIQGVSECYMKNYGLYNSKNPKFFSYDAQTVARICRDNSKLKSTDFITVHNKPGDAKRPYLVVNSSITGPYKDAPFKNPEPLVVMNYTPLGIGSAQPITTTYTPESGKVGTVLPIGGGFVEPFAFGGTAPMNGTSFVCIYAPNNNCVAVNTPKTPYTMADAAGTSSSAFVAEFTSYGIGTFSLTDLSPRAPYWPVAKTSIPAERDFIYGDGGNLENLGAITLIQRKVNKLVIFVNTDTELNIKFDSTKIPGSSDVSSDILTLFGIRFSGSVDMNQNKVFPTSDIHGLMSQLTTKKKLGQSIIAKTSHTTVANPWWGIPAGQKIDITWVYNDAVSNFHKQLELAIRLDIDAGDLGSFPHFPRYNTVDENLGRLVELTPKQINLLYQFSAWNVYSNASQFAFLAK